MKMEEDNPPAAELRIKALIFRQDYRINKDIFAFPEERQKGSSLFEGNRSLIALSRQ